MTTQAQAQGADSKGGNKAEVIVEGRTLDPKDEDAAAREKAVSMAQEANRKQQSEDEKRKEIPKIVGHLLHAALENDDPANDDELQKIFDAFEIDEDQAAALLMEIQENPRQNFGPGSMPLKSLGLPPELNKSEGFYRPPGSKKELMGLYFPRRFKTMPEEDWFESGSIIYSVFEDESFFALHPDQQTVEAQAALTLPTCNRYAVVGGVDASGTEEKSEKPKAAKKK